MYSITLRACSWFMPLVSHPNEFIHSKPPIYNISDEALLFAHRFSCCGTKKDVVSQPTFKIIIVLTGFETWFIEFDVRSRIIGPFFQRKANAVTDKAAPLSTQVTEGGFSRYTPNHPTESHE